MTEYLNFEVRIGLQGNAYRVYANSPEGEASVSFYLPPQHGLEILMRGPSKEDIKSFGEQLFNAVFMGEVRDCFIRSVNLAQKSNKVLRLRLRLNEAPELADLPWEYLYGSPGGRFHALSLQISIVRYLEIPEPAPALRLPPPLKVLVMISNPDDAPKLNGELEWKKLETALEGLTQRGLVSLERLDHATLESLQQRLSKNEYHVLHYIGHGRWDPQKRRAGLILENEDHRSQFWSGDDIGMILQGPSPVRLVVLNACEGTRTTWRDPFSGIAQRLVQLGVPAVIAMQFPITDDAAITFAENFYDNFADNSTLDEALTHARRAIFARGNDTEWGTPVLYSRSTDGVLFDFDYSKLPEGESPFTIGLPVTRPRHFFGRNAKLIEIFDSLRERPLQNTAIVGPTHSGKTSLLHYIKNITTASPNYLRPGQRSNWLHEPERYRWIFANLHDPRLGNQHGFLRYLLAQMDLPVPDSCGMEYFMSEVGRKLHHPTVILLNGMSYALECYPDLDKQFWNAMRALVTDPKVEGRLAFIIALPNLKHILAKKYGAAMESDFFNLFVTTHLKPFEEEEALEFIASLPAEFSPEEVEWILQKSYRWPAYMQILCRARLHALQIAPSINSWKEEGLSQMKEIIVPPLPPPPPPPPPKLWELICRFVRFMLGFFARK